MARLIVSNIVSLDGFVCDTEGNFDWSMPNEAVHALVNALQRDVGTALYGRKLYDVMVAWETMPLEGEPPVIREFAELWRKAEKIVCSKTLKTVSSAKTRIVESLDLGWLARLKASTANDIAIGGPTLAAHAFKAGLVDELQLFASPVIVGGGTHFFPAETKITLALRETRRFENRVVYSRYDVTH